MQKGVVFLLRNPADVRHRHDAEGTDLSVPVRANRSRGLAAVAEFGAGLPWILARMIDAGAGTVTAATWEYGNTVHDRRRPSERPDRPRRVRYRDGAQVTDHFLLMALFAFFVSLVFAVLMRDEPRAQLRLGGNDVSRLPRLGARARLADVSLAAMTDSLENILLGQRTAASPRSRSTARRC